MCRLFALTAGSRRTRATFWLLEAPDSLAEQSRRNPDGYGIATFDDDGRYGNRTDGTCHAALYLEQDENRIMVVDQWKGQPPHERPLRFNQSSTAKVNRGEAFFVVV